MNVYFYQIISMIHEVKKKSKNYLPGTNVQNLMQG